jgi:ComF family protein
MAEGRAERIDRQGGAAVPLRRFVRRAVDLVLPPRCLCCGAVMGDDAGLCPACWPKVDFVGAPMCARCGLPFEFAVEETSLCGACAAKPPPYLGARAVFRYDDASRDLILGFKHADKLHGAPAFARWMAAAGADLIAASDAILPVPLHWRRLFARRYNQAEVLATALGRATGLPVLPDAVRRRRATPSQGHLTRAQRGRNVAGAFAVPAKRRHLVAGRKLLLVDDVMTTGSTIGAVCRTLRRAGAGELRVLVLARVVHPMTLG